MLIIQRILRESDINVPLSHDMLIYRGGGYPHPMSKKKMTPEERLALTKRLLADDPGIKKVEAFTRLITRVVSSDEGEIRKSGFEPNTVYHIIEALDPPVIWEK